MCLLYLVDIMNDLVCDHQVYDTFFVNIILNIKNCLLCFDETMI